MTRTQPKWRNCDKKEGDMSKVINVNQKKKRVYEVSGVSLSNLKHILIAKYMEPG
jgi:hypothetical protein